MSEPVSAAMTTEVACVEARDTIPLRSIDELCIIALNEWKAMDVLIEGARKKVQARRIKIGHILLELQQRIDAGENGDLCTFWEWFEDMFTRSRSDAERLMTIARDDDPEGAYQRRLEKQKEYTERHYRRKLGAPSSKITTMAPQSYKMEAEPAQPPVPETEAEPELLPPSNPKSRFPEADGDDEIVEEIVALYGRLSWGGRYKANKRILALYNTWKRGGR
jgi:hypothetical protein